MKNKLRSVIGCAVSIAAVSMLSSMAVLADDTNIEGKWAYTAVANVNTMVNIRANASTDSAVVGYLPKAATAKVIERGAEWTHIISGGVEGYIKDEFLAYGAEAKKLANVYGTPGVEISWDDVKLFATPDCCSKILNSANTGKEYELLNDEGAWYSVQMDDVTVAYVPAEDVQKTMILERAIPVEYVAEGSSQYTAENWKETYASNDSAATAAPQESTDTTVYDNNNAADTAYAEEPTYTADTAYTEEDTYTDTTTDVTAAQPAEDNSGDASSEETVTNASSDDLSLLAALIYCEAGNQSREGKVAVGAVVMNRIASSSYPGNISDVIYQGGQFAPAITGWLGQVLASGAPSECYEAAQAALNGENPVPGALYFNTSAGKGTKIGAHWFY